MAISPLGLKSLLLNLGFKFFKTEFLTLATHYNLLVQMALSEPKGNRFEPKILDEATRPKKRGSHV
jgi:hypothetical protein